MRFSDFRKNYALLASAGVVLVVSLIVGFSTHHLHIADGGSGNYRWRNDDGSETTATFTLAENTPRTNLAKNTGVRLRMAASNPGNESELLRKAALTIGSAANLPRSAVIDTATGYAYFGTNTTPGQIVKVALGSGASAPTQVATLTLNSGENQLTTAVIDTTNGYAYFSTFTSPSNVVKVALGVGAAAPTRVGAVTLNSGENQIVSAVIDTTAGYAYLGTQTSPGIVVKVALGAGAAAPTRTAALTLNSGEDLLRSSVIDPTNGYAYFGTGTSPGIVVKVLLGAGAAAPTRTAALTLNSGEDILRSAVIDPTNGYAYFGTDTDPGIVVKVLLGAGAAAPTRTAALALEGGLEIGLRTAVIDTASGYAYFGTFGEFGFVVKVALGAGAAAPTRIDRTFSTTLFENGTVASAIDPGNGYAYFGAFSSPGQIDKIALGTGAAAPSLTASLTFTGDLVGFRTAVIDTANSFAYFGTDTSPGQVIKVALGAGAAAPTINSTLVLNSGENNLTSAVIDTTNGYAYFGTNTSPGIVIKVALSTNTRVGAVTLNSGENLLTSAGIDATNSYAYFGTNTSPGIVVKVALGAGAATPTRTAAVTLNSGENLLTAAAIDTTNSYAFFGTSTSPGQVIKVALGAGAAAPTRTGSVTLNSGENTLTAAAIDTTNSFVYFTVSTSPGIVVKVALGSGAATPTRSSSVTFNSGENLPLSGVIDPANGYAYFGTNAAPTFIVKTSTTQHITFRLEYGLKSNTCSAITGWTQVPTTAVLQDWQMVDTVNLTDGAATTNSVFINDPNPSFKAGVVKDTSSQTVAIAVGEREFTELEFSIKPTTNAVAGGTYCFRLTNAGAVTGITGNQYPEAVIASVSVSTRWRNDNGSESTATFMAAENVALTNFIKNTPVRLRLAAGGSDSGTELLQKPSLTLNSGENNLTAGVIDPVNGYAYYGTNTSPGRVVKVALGVGNVAPTRVAALTLNSGENALKSAVIDTVNGYAYFGTDTSPAIIIKVALGAGNAAPTRVAALTLNSGENLARQAVIDTVNGYAYFSMQVNAGIIVKVALGAGAAAPTRVGAATLGNNEGGGGVVIDTANGYLYVGTVFVIPTVLVKVSLGVGAAAPSRVAGTTLTTSTTTTQSGAFDTTNGYLYINSNGTIKIAPGAGAAAPTEIGLVSGLAPVVFNTADGYLYGTGGSQRIAPGVGAALPTLAASTTVTGASQATTLDSTNGYIYSGSSGSPGVVTKVSIYPRAAFRLEYGTKDTTCSAIGVWAQVGAAGSTAGEHWVMSDTTNLTDGAATTNNAGITDSDTTFKSGFVQDTSSQTGIIPLREFEFTELEYSIKATDSAVNGSTYCFRLTDAGSVTNVSTTNYAEAAMVASTPSGSSGGSNPGTSSGPVCGNALCEEGETGDVCPTDCFTGTTPPPEPTTEPPPAEEVPGEPPPSQSTQYDPAEEKAEAPNIGDDLGIEAPSSPPLFVLCTPESLIKGSGPALYYCGEDGKRYVFPNEQVFFTWFKNFDEAITVSNATLAAIPLGGMIGHRPGVRMVKLNTDPKVYAVTKGAILRWVSTEAVAVLVYGPNWNQFIDDITTEEFSLYTIGAPITE